MPLSERISKSPVIQFYSSADNIGNYLPVIGIHKMLRTTPDVWNAHDVEIDYEFINSHYRSAIVGGAGLFHACFEGFWRRFVAECDLPAIIWGVGLCAPDRVSNFGVNRSLVSRNASRFDLVNVRDDWTAEFYGLKVARVSVCPTVVAVADFARGDPRRGTLVVSHTSLTGTDLDLAVRSVVESAMSGVRFTDNVQHRTKGIARILRSDYDRSERVVTTRLHGAIIAYGLGVPYVALARDEKIRAFQRQFGNGELVENTTDLRTRLANSPAASGGVMMNDVVAFGETARKWMLSWCPVE